MNTLCLQDDITGYAITLKPIQYADIERIRQWRNHPDVSQHMINTDHISQKQQEQWFNKIDKSDKQYHYIIDYKGESQGVVSLHSLNESSIADSKTLEAGIYLKPESKLRGSLLAFAPALALNDWCFNNLGCEMLVAKVKKDNVPAIRFNLTLGYQSIRETKKLIYLELTSESYQTASKSIKNMFR